MNTFLYNPDQKSKQEIISEFVVREKIYEQIMQDLESSPMKYPEQDYLLVGQRGMGKTTLLLRLKYGIEDSPILREKLIPIAFTEEQYQIIQLSDLWEYIGEYLVDHQEFTDMYNKMRKHTDLVNFEEKAYDILETTLKKEEKKIVLLIDNLGDLFSKLETIEMHRLREILQTSNGIRIIGGSTNYRDILQEYHHPFYEFFKVIRLDGLTKGESVQLIRKLSELYNAQEKIEQIITNEPGRIETLRILTGGVPRTIALLFGIFLDHEHEHALKDLYRILDLVTPLYKHRMDDLPIQQQKIIDAVAKHWEPITVKDLTSKTRLLSKTLSAQLNQLEKDQIIIKNSTNNKNKTYLIRERFWNIWYLMRYGKKDDKEKVIWLVRFLESWLSSDDIKKRIDSFVEKVKTAKIDETQLSFFSKIYASLNNIPLHSKLKLKSIEAATGEEINLSDEDWYVCAEENYAKGNYIESITHLLHINNWQTREIDMFLNSTSHLEVPFSKQIKGPLSLKHAQKLVWASSVLITSLGIRVLNAGIQYDILLPTLKQSFEEEILLNEMNGRTPGEYLISIIYTSKLFNMLIQKGLYNAAFKLVDEAHIIKDNKAIYLKDQWKPLYLAIKYLYQPEELAKQPSELSTEAFSIAEILKKQPA